MVSAGPAVVAPVLGRWAADALREEALLSPKPGLVDGRGPGAHADMDLRLLLRSAEVLEPWFALLADAGRDRAPDAGLAAELGEIGRRAEGDMLAATGGVNTHRGALFSLGLLVAGASSSGSSVPDDVATQAAVLARSPGLAATAGQVSHGDQARRLVPQAGARTQAQDGFPAVVGVSLPTLRARRAQGAPEQAARLDALLALMAVVDDTCVLFRGGAAGLRLVQQGATEVLDRGGVATPAGRVAMAVLDRRLSVAGLSPGGSGDLLAATLLLDRLERGPCKS